MVGYANLKYESLSVINYEEGTSRTKRRAKALPTNGVAGVGSNDGNVLRRSRPVEGALGSRVQLGNGPMYTKP
jgi:hypothetical protein